MSLGPSVLDGKIRYLSVSQIEKFDHACFGGCERRWWFRYPGQKKEPQKGSQKLGEQCHSQVEHYLKTGEDVLRDVVRAGQIYIPKPGNDLLVEYAFGAPRELAPGSIHGLVDSPLDAGGVPVIGKVDLMHRRALHIDDAGQEVQVGEDAAEVNDWKTTKQIDDTLHENGSVDKRGYAKKAAEVAGTWQMLGYGELVRRIWPSVKKVRLAHTYFQTQGQRAAAKRSLVLAVDDIQAKWAKSAVVVERMKKAALATKPEDVPANYAACSAFGGCPHRAYCPRDPMMAMAAMFGSKFQGGFKSAPSAEKESGVMSLLAKRRAERNGTNGVAVMSAPVTAVGVVAPAPTPVTTVAAATFTASDVEAEKKKLLAEEAAAVETITPPDLPAPEKISEPLEASHAVAKAKGKKKKEAPTGDPTVPTLTAPPELASRSSEVVQPSSLTLYLDAVEDGIKTQRLEAYAEEHASALAEAYKAADIRCAPKDSPLAFGGWKGALAAIVREDPPVGAWSVSSSSEIGLVAFEALAPKARVVRGVR